jgi:hypothetical protein
MPITLNGDTGITTPSYGGADTAEYLVPVTAFKNRLINGGMVIDQRNGGASVTPNSSAYTLDRWELSVAVSSKLSVQQSSTAPAGFRNSVLLTSTSAYTPSASDYMTFCQKIEGFNVADLMWGTANAQTITLSFWVRSSLTGTFSGALQSENAGRSYPFTFTISAANTFEYKTVTIPGDTSGTWNTTTGKGVEVHFNMGSGSNLLGTAGTWVSAWRTGATGSVALVGTSGATMYLTGVQFEVGSNATYFDVRPYGTELALCQRYYYNTMWIRDANSLTAPTNNQVELQGARHQFGDVTGYRGQMYSHPVLMRGAPTMVVYNANNGGATGQWYFYNFNGASQNYSGGPAGYRDGITFNAYTGVSVGTAGMSCQVWAHWSANSEL